MNIEDGRVVVNRPSMKRSTARSMASPHADRQYGAGVTVGFEKRLEIHGVGYRAAKQGNKLVLSMGFSHPVEFDTPPGMEIEVPAPTRITVRGIDKEKVGQLAAEIRAVRKPEPYLGKGIRYEGEYVRRKAGKAGK